VTRRRTPAALALLLPLVPLAAGGATLTVLAAASLTETFTTLADEFEARHDGVEVDLAFDSSATLAQHAVDGAPGDVLATADEATMRVAVDGGAVAEGPEVFATNVAVLVTPPDNPARITTLGDLDGDDVTYVVCVETAPCGAIADTLLSEGGITHEPASLEVDVKAVLAKVAGDEADAGIVYASDAVAAGDRVSAIDIEGAGEHRNRYPIATLEQSEHAGLAREFVDLVRSEQGQSLLADAGFGGPT
jgi:molybdate transport system substrate-binding protein